MRISTVWTIFCAVFLCVSATLAAGQTPIPKFTGAQLYLAGVGDQYRVLEDDLRQVQSDSPQTYYLVVVASTGNGDWATRDYIDRLYDRWQSEARSAGLTLDAHRSVIILLAEKNRQISLHFGAQLQSQFGLSGSAINDRLVDPFFLPHARAGNYVEGLRALLHGTEQWIRQKEAEERNRREAAVRRAAEIRHSAEAALGTATQLREQAQQQLEISRSAGFQVEEPAKLLQSGSAALDKASAALAEDAAGALERANRVQQGLQALLDQLRQLPALAAQAEQSQAALSRAVVDFDNELEQAARKDLPVAGLKARVGQLRDELDQAMVLVRTDPATAQTMVDRGRAELQALRRRLADLPGLQIDFHAREKSVVDLLDIYETELQAAVRAGAGVAPQQADLWQQRADAQLARDLTQTDLRGALASLQSVEQRLQAGLREVRDRHARHVLLTRTLPLTVLMVFLALVAAAAGLRIWWYRLRRRRTDAALREFRSYTTNLLDRLETLKKRHQLLPFSDPDYGDTLSGATLEFYNQFDQHHEELRRLWLDLMAAREKIELLAQTANVVRAAPLRAADTLLAQWDKQAAEDTGKRCDEHLHRLEQAHEEARETAQVVEQLQASALAQIESLRSHQLDVAAYESEIEACRARCAAAAELLQNDPLAAGAMFLEVRTRLAATAEQCSHVLEQAERAQQLDAQWQQAAAQVAAKRGEGLRLDEPQGNPDPLLEQARTLQAGAREALDAGDSEAAAQLLERGAELIAQAAALVQAQLEAREYALREIPERQRRDGELKDWVLRGRDAFEQLQREFAAESWSDMAGWLPQAERMLGESASLQQRAQTAASGQVQRYFEARDTLRGVAQQQDEAGRLLEGVTSRLVELKRLRDDCREQRQAVLRQAEELQQWLARHEHLVGPRAGELAQVAEKSRQLAHAASAESQPHWPAIYGWLEDAAGNYTAALQQAAEDVRVYERFVVRLSEVVQQSKRVEHLLRSNTADRPRANQRYRDAAEEINSLLQYETRGWRDWADLLRRVEQAAADLISAEEWALEDIRISQQAAAELRQAERAMEAGGIFYLQGISADMSRARSLLDEARRQFLSQAYEQAIQLADQAELAARQAVAETERRAAERRRRRELEERRRAAATIVTSTMRAGGSALGGIQIGGLGSSSNSHSSGSSTSSSRSWSSGSSQRSW